LRVNYFHILLTGAICISGFATCRQSQNDIIEKETIINDKPLFLPNRYAKNQFAEGIRYVHKQDYQNAKQCFFNADSANPGNAYVLSNLGNSIAMTESVNLSFMYFREAIGTDSSIAQPYINYGYWLNRDKFFQEAKDILTTGLKKAKYQKADQATFCLNLAYSLKMLGQDAEARDVIDEGLQGLNPGPAYDRLMLEKNSW
jgi:Tfp pilus assembly protein PilF